MREILRPAVPVDVAALPDAALAAELNAVEAQVLAARRSGRRPARLVLARLTALAVEQAARRTRPGGGGEGPDTQQPGPPHG